MAGSMRLWLVLAILAAGCIGPPQAPADAVTATDPALQGLVLSAWTDAHGERLRMHGLLHNDGGSYDIRYGCGEPWNSTIVAPDGAVVPYRQVMEDPKCPVLWDVLRPGAYLDILYSWDYRAHDPEAGSHVPVAPGNYTWVLQVSLRGRAEVLETQIPIRVG